MKLPSIEEMLKAGMHFGHRTSKWHPKMKEYVFGVRKGIYIVDLEKSREHLGRALEFMTKVAASGGKILFVGTKPQASGLIKQAAQNTGMPYVCEHWLGGTVTNFTVIKRSIRKYKDLLDKKETGKLVKYTKKEQLEFDRQIAKMGKSFGGLVDLNTTPEAIFIWDIKTENTALAEAKKKGIPLIAVCDTNVNPQGIAYVIPSNDDASKAIKLVLDLATEAILVGKSQHQAAKQVEERPARQ